MSNFKQASTLDKYRKAPPQKEDTSKAPKNEIKVLQKNPRIHGYIMYAANLLLKENEDSVVIKAAGNAAPKAVLV